MTQTGLADAIGVDESTVQNLESARFGRGFSRTPSSAGAAARYFGWTPDSVQRVLEGGDPVTEPSREEAAGGAVKKRGDLPLRIVDELESGDPLLDSTVIQLPGDGDARMTIVVRGKANATPQEIQDALIAWRKAERSLHRLPDDDDDDEGESQAANGS